MSKCGFLILNNVVFCVNSRKILLDEIAKYTEAKMEVSPNNAVSY